MCPTTVNHTEKSDITYEELTQHHPQQSLHQGFYPLSDITYEELTPSYVFIISSSPDFHGQSDITYEELTQASEGKMHFPEKFYSSDITYEELTLCSV